MGFGRPAVVSYTFLCLLLLAWNAALLCAQTGKPKETPEFEKLAEGVYAHIASADSNAVSNAGFIILDHFVLVFDTHFTLEAGQELAARIHAITPKPVRYLMNSHFHPDHTHGNQAFPGALEISSTATRRDMLQKDIPALNRSLTMADEQLQKLNKQALQEHDPRQLQMIRSQIAARQEFLSRMSKLKIIPPIITLDDSLTVRDGTHEVQLLYLGAGHTNGDVVLFLPSEKVAFLGDLFFNAALPNTQDAILLDWIKTLGEVLRLDAEKFVPGHGPVGGRKDVQEFLRYLEELKALVAPAVNRGDTLDQVLHDVHLPGKFSAFGFQSFFQSNVQKMFTELKAQQLSAPPFEGPKMPELEKTRP